MDHERAKGRSGQGGVMAKVILMKRGKTLVASDDESADALAKIKEGKQVTAEIKRSRNPQMHRLYFALVRLVFDNLPEEMAKRYPTQDQLHNAMKVSAGIYTPFTLADGREGLIPGSISFEKMDQAAFEAFWAKVCDAVEKYFLPGVTSKELRDTVEGMIGMRTAA
jgi:NAD-dependent DNA ligase